MGEKGLNIFMELQKYEIEHNKKMREIAPECMVLLKSDGTFPLREACDIAIYGSGARNTLKGGTGSGEVNVRHYVTIEEGLEKEGFQITTKSWLADYENIRANAKKAFVKSVKAQAKQEKKSIIALAMGAIMPEPEYKLSLNGTGEVCIYVLSRVSGEGNDRKAVKGDVLLTDTEIRDILECQRQYKKFMLVLNVGGVVDLSPVMEVRNILLLSQLGVSMGDAFADVIIGKAYPSGKVATTWSAFDDYCKEGDFGQHKDTHYSEGIYVGYRYFEKNAKKPLFAFGYGLGFTNFKIENGSLTYNSDSGEAVCKITNTGNNLGKEVVQLYVSKPTENMEHPVKELIGFSKTRELKPGESQEVKIIFAIEDMKSFDETKEFFVIERGIYEFFLGNSSDNTYKCGEIKLEEDIYPSKRTEISMPSEKALGFAKNLSDKQLAMLLVGRHQEGAAAQVIGSAGQKVSGAAGENYSGIDGVPAMIMADGPAGLRLNQKFLKVADGTEGIMEDLPSDMADFMPGILMFLMKQKAKKQLKGDVHYQYCTAIPIGTAIAQSWNLELAENCGDIVGQEMEHFGVNLWLAPAFNIHRNILCGRNYEYYSEDPVVSGKFGAAITNGVQKHPGCGVTVKHLCCNNQETNRYMNNSVVSERTLREIYLRPFEIVVREASPAAIMTSYNLLNGVHTSEDERLLKGIVRTEWGYEGLIMSDWVVTSVMFKGEFYDHERVVESIKAGNDLFMPGCTEDYNEILSALQGNSSRAKLTRDEAEFCAARILDTVWGLCE